MRSFILTAALACAGVALVGADANAQLFGGGGLLGGRRGGGGGDRGSFNVRERSSFRARGNFGGFERGGFERGGFERSNFQFRESFSTRERFFIQPIFVEPAGFDDFEFSFRQRSSFSRGGFCR